MPKATQLSIPDIIATVQEHELADEARLLVTSSCGRIGVFAVTDDGVVLMVDAIPTENDVGAIAGGVRPSLIGRWDAGERNRWTHAWTVGTKDWMMWTRADGRAFWIESGAIHRSGPRPPLQAETVAAIQIFASEGWYEQGAEIRLEDETTIGIALSTNWAARLDPSYDYHQLIDDLSWAETLCKDLATVLGVPVGERIPDRID